MMAEHRPSSAGGSACGRRRPGRVREWRLLRRRRPEDRATPTRAALAPRQDRRGEVLDAAVDL